MRIWLDTDIGTDVDDALALAYVLRHPEIELVGASTVFGDVGLRTEIVEALLRLGDGPSIPVVTGLGVPLTPGRHGLMFGHEGQGLVPGADPVRRLETEAGGADRVDALAGAVTDAGPDVLVAIGPMTNLGALAAAGVALPPVVVMGGKIADVMLPGMSDRIPEWNWYCDPVAVQRVLAAEPPSLRVVPAEITFQTSLADGDVDALAAGDPLAAAVADLCRRWLGVLRERFDREQPRVALHDPLTTAVLVEPDLCRFEGRRIEVGDRGESTLLDGAANLEAAVTVDADGARQAILATILGDR